MLERTPYSMKFMNVGLNAWQQRFFVNPYVGKTYFPTSTIMQFSGNKRTVVIFKVMLLFLFFKMIAFFFFLSHFFFLQSGVYLFAGHSFIFLFPAVLVLKQICLIYFPKGSRLRLLFF